MVIAEAHALAQHPGTERGQPLAIRLPLLIAAELRTPIERRIDRTLDAVLHLAVDHDLDAVIGEALQMRADALDLFFDGRLGEMPGVPAGHACESILVELCLQGCRLSR